MRMMGIMRAIVSRIVVIVAIVPVVVVVYVHKFDSVGVLVVGGSSARLHRRLGPLDLLRGIGWSYHSPNCVFFSLDEVLPHSEHEFLQVRSQLKHAVPVPNEICCGVELVLLEQAPSAHIVAILPFSVVMMYQFSRNVVVAPVRNSAESPQSTAFLEFRRYLEALL